MLNHRYFSTLATTVVFAGSVVALHTAYADTPPTSVKAGSVMDQRMMVSNEGFQAERDIRAARVAIFDGGIDQAKTLVKNAQAELSSVASQAPNLTTSNTQGQVPNSQADTQKATTKAADGKQVAATDLIPIDGQMMVADDMVLTPDKAAKVKEANEHLKNGETDKAMDTLKQGAIDITYTRLLMPVNGTTVHVTAAENLLNQGKYYEANLALKAAQDLVQTDTVMLGNTPAQASKITGVPAAGAKAATTN